MTNVTDGANEIIRINGVDVALTNGNSVATGVGTAGVSLSSGTATVTLTGATLNAAALQTLIDGLAYLNSSDNPTDANRVVTITQVVDSGLNSPPDDSTTDLTGVTSIVNVNPVNDPALITGDASGTVQESGGVNNGTPGVPVTDSGDLDSTDVDGTNDAWFVVSTPATSISGYGTYTVTAAGVWSYTVDDTNTTVQALNGVATLSDSFNVTTADGTAQLVTITINAQNDNATITGDDTGSVTEAGGIANATVNTPSDTGDLDHTDPDNTADVWQAVLVATATAHGTYTLTRSRECGPITSTRTMRRCRRSTSAARWRIRSPRSRKTAPRGWSRSRSTARTTRRRSPMSMPTRPTPKTPGRLRSIRCH